MNVSRFIGCCILSVVIGALFSLVAVQGGFPVWAPVLAQQTTLGGLLLMTWSRP